MGLAVASGMPLPENLGLLAGGGVGVSWLSGRSKVIRLRRRASFKVVPRLGLESTSCTGDASPAWSIGFVIARNGFFT